MVRMKPSPWIALFGLPFLLPGLLLLAYLAERQVEGWRRRVAWTPRPAEVLRVFHERVANSPRARHRVRVAYRYAVDGREYRSQVHDVCQDPPFHLMTLDRSLTGEYRPGEHVTAWVNPADPAAAVLSTRVPHLGFLTVLALLLVSIGLPFVASPWITRPGPALPALMLALNLAMLLLWTAPGSFGHGSTSSAIVLALLTLPLLWLDLRLLRRRDAASGAPPTPPAP